MSLTSWWVDVPRHHWQPHVVERNVQMKTERLDRVVASFLIGREDLDAYYERKAVGMRAPREFR